MWRCMRPVPYDHVTVPFLRRRVSAGMRRMQMDVLELACVRDEGRWAWMEMHVLNPPLIDDTAWYPVCLLSKLVAPLHHSPYTTFPTPPS